MKRCVRITTLLFLFININVCKAGGPPPIELMEGSIVLISIPYNEPIGPSIGTEMTPFAANDISGVLIVSDEKKNGLWHLNKERRTMHFQFAPGRDIVLEINNRPVKSSIDALRNTHKGWNKLLINDLGTGETAEYWIQLESE